MHSKDQNLYSQAHIISIARVLRERFKTQSSQLQSTTGQYLESLSESEFDQICNQYLFNFSSHIKFSREQIVSICNNMQDLFGFSYGRLQNYLLDGIFSCMKLAELQYLSQKNLKLETIRSHAAKNNFIALWLVATQQTPANGDMFKFTDYAHILNWAISQYRAGTVKISIFQNLLSDGADPNNSDFGPPYSSPLHFACSHGLDDVVDILLQSGADIDSRKSQYGGTPLMVAVSGNKLSTVDLLTRKGAGVNLKSDNGNGDIPLYLAVANGYQSIACILLAHGARVNDCTNSGDRNLPTAVIAGQKKMVEILLQYGATVEEKDIEVAKDAETKALLQAAYLKQQLSRIGNVFGLEITISERVQKQMLDAAAAVDAAKKVDIGR